MEVRRSFFVLLLISAAACSTVPKTADDRTNLHRQANAELIDFRQKDPTLDSFIGTSYGYAIFPAIDKGAVVFGGAYGNGEVYERGNRIGYADITQYTIGLALGGQQYAELLMFQDKAALEKFKSGNLVFAANFSAIAVNAGAGASLKYDNGIAAVVKPKGGLMGEAALGGQSFGFKPLEPQTMQPQEHPMEAHSMEPNPLGGSLPAVHPLNAQSIETPQTMPSVSMPPPTTAPNPLDMPGSTADEPPPNPLAPTTNP